METEQAVERWRIHFAYDEAENPPSALAEWHFSSVRVAGQELANVPMVICRFLQFLGFHVCLWQ